MPQWGMHAPQASAADAAMAAPDRVDDHPNVLDTLYRIAVGPTGRAHYPRRFEEFETLGRTRTRWNWAAALLTLGWLIYRRLWGAALVYAAATEGLLLLWFGALRPWLQPPMPVEAGLGLALALTGCVVPGLWGDALVYTDVRKRTMHALESAPTLAQARAQLERQAPTRRCLLALIALHAALALAMGAAVRWLPQAPPQAVAPAVPPALAMPPASAPEARAPGDPASRAPLPAVAQPHAPAASAPEATTSAQAPARCDGCQPRSEATPAPAPAQPPATPEAAPVRPRQSPVAQSLEPRRYYINVGVFADASNAQKAQQQLQRAGLPLVVQTVGTNKGDRIRVRAGPFHQAEDAEAAAQRVRAQGLEAVVFQHR